MGQIEDVILLTREIESLLVHLGAEGKGMHQKISSVQGTLDDALVKKLRWIASLRNKVVHQHDFYIDDMEDYTDACYEAIDSLKYMITPPKIRSSFFETIGEAIASFFKIVLIIIGILFVLSLIGC